MQDMANYSALISGHNCLVRDVMANFNILYFESRQRSS
jgi:hypothetical protein